MLQFGNNRRVSLTLVGFLAATAPAVALEAVDVLNYTWGKLTLKPQIDFTGTVIDNLFYGNNAIVQINRFLLATNVSGITNGTVSLTSGTNFLGTRTNITTILRRAESDYQLVVSPGARFLYGYSDANNVEFAYNLDKIFYLQHSKNNTDQHIFELKTKVADGHWQVTGQDQLQLLSSFIGGGSFFGRNGLINRRVWNDLYHFNYDFSSKTYFYFEGNHSNLDYDKGLNVFDTDTLRGSLGGGYHLTGLVSLFTEGHYGQSSLQPNLTTQSKAPHSVFYGGYVGFKGDFTARLTGMVKVGYETRMFPAGSTTRSGASSPAVEASLTYVPTLKSQIALNYSKKTDVSQYFGSQTLTYDTVGLTFQQTIGSSGKWLIQIQGNYSVTDNGDLTQPISVPQADADNFSKSVTVLANDPASHTATLLQLPQSISGNVGRTDVQLSLGPTLIYQPRPWLQASVGYRFEHYTPQFRDANYASTHPLIPYDVNQFTFRIAIGF